MKWKKHKPQKNVSLVFFSADSIRFIEFLFYWTCDSKHSWRKKKEFFVGGTLLYKISILYFFVFFISLTSRSRFYNDVSIIRFYCILKNHFYVNYRLFQVCVLRYLMIFFIDYGEFFLEIIIKWLNGTGLIFSFFCGTLILLILWEILLYWISTICLWHLMKSYWIINILQFS